MLTFNRGGLRWTISHTRSTQIDFNAAQKKRGAVSVYGSLWLACLAETRAELVCLVCRRMCSVQLVDVAADGRSVHSNLPDRMMHRP